MSSFKLLPVLVLVASLAFAVRVAEVYTGARGLSGAAYAEEKPTDKSAEKNTEKKQDVEKKDTVPETNGSNPPSSADLKKASAEKSAASDVDLPSTDKLDAKESRGWQDASEGDLDYSNVRKEVYQDLMRRRQDLDTKEKELSKREALIKASENELDRKYQELEGIRNEIQDLLKKQSAEEEARIASLVKIYEGMKAKDAARIFNTLDMDVLLEVVSKMSERKSAPIIAEMDDDRARSLTLFLAEQKKLPSVPQQGASSGAP